MKTVLQNYMKYNEVAQDNVHQRYPELVDDTLLKITNEEYVKVFEDRFIPIIRVAVDEWYKKIKDGGGGGSNTGNDDLEQHHSSLLESLNEHSSMDKCLRQRHLDDMLITDSCRHAMDLGAERLDEIIDESDREYALKQRRASRYHRPSGQVLLVFNATLIVFLLMKLWLGARATGSVAVKERHHLLNPSADTHSSTHRDEEGETNPCVQGTNASRVQATQFYLVAQWIASLLIGSFALAAMQSWSTTHLFHFAIDSSILCATALLVTSIVGILQAREDDGGHMLTGALDELHGPGNTNGFILAELVPGSGRILPVLTRSSASPNTSGPSGQKSTPWPMFEYELCEFSEAKEDEDVGDGANSDA